MILTLENDPGSAKTNRHTKYVA